MRLIDEYRKEKRRRDFSSDESDDDPFHNKSTAFGFNATRNRFNATPASSTIKADSIAGRSRASTIKGTGGPVNISAAGGKGANATPSAAGDQEFTEDVGGVEEYHARLKELWNKRTQLMKTKKKPKKKPGKGKNRVRSALRKTQTSMDETATVWDDDKTSFMTTQELGQKDQE